MSEKRGRREIRKNSVALKTIFAKVHVVVPRYFEFFPFSLTSGTVSQRRSRPT